MKDEMRFIYRIMLPILIPEQDRIDNYVVVKSEDSINGTKKQKWYKGHQWTVLDKFSDRCNNLGTMQDFINNL